MLSMGVCVLEKCHRYSTISIKGAMFSCHNSLFMIVLCFGSGIWRVFLDLQSEFVCIFHRLHLLGLVDLFALNLPFGVSHELRVCV